MYLRQNNSKLLGKSTIIMIHKHFISNCINVLYSSENVSSYYVDKRYEYRVIIFFKFL